MQLCANQPDNHTGMTNREVVITKLRSLSDPLLQQVNDFIDSISQEPKEELSSGNSEKRVTEIEKILKETKGSWGNSSMDEIDARLAEQRKLDWGE
jgi:hypothetical protein